MSKWTPGPWKIVQREVMEDGSVYPEHIVGGERELQVCIMESMFIAEKIAKEADSFWRNSPSHDANARLIAAAPRMAEALNHAYQIGIGGLTPASETLSAWHAILAEINGDTK